MVFVKILEFNINIKCILYVKRIHEYIQVLIGSQTFGNVCIITNITENKTEEKLSD